MIRPLTLRHVAPRCLGLRLAAVALTLGVVLQPHRAPPAAPAAQPAPMLYLAIGNAIRLVVFGRG